MQKSSRYISFCIVVILACGVRREASAQTPPHAASPSKAEGHEAAISVPLEYTNRHLYVTLSGEGLGSLVLLVDTGWQSTTITASRILGGSRAARKRTQLPGGYGSDLKEQSRGSVDLALGVEGVPVYAGSATVLNLEELAQHLQHPVDGVLGWDFFAQWCSAIDYRGRRLVLHSLSNCSPPSGRYGKLRGVWSSHGLLLPATIRFANGGSTAAKLLLDTGSDDGVTLRDRFRAVAGLTGAASLSRPSMVNRGWGVNGGFSSDRVPLASIDFEAGHLTLTATGEMYAAVGRPGSVRVPHWWWRGALGTRAVLHDGTIGNALLEHFVWMINPRAKRVYMVPSEKE